MNDRDLEITATAAYNTYGDFVGWKNYAGLPMPTWADLPEKIRGAWKAATHQTREGFAESIVPKFQDDPLMTWEERFKLLEKHHILETTVLAARVKDVIPPEVASAVREGMRRMPDCYSFNEQILRMSKLYCALYDLEEAGNTFTMQGPGGATTQEVEDWEF